MNCLSKRGPAGNSFPLYLCWRGPGGEVPYTTWNSVFFNTDNSLQCSPNLESSAFRSPKKQGKDVIGGSIINVVGYIIFFSNKKAQHLLMLRL
jgi:hypothetical protein